MEMELISRETIKPSSPTPPHLKIYPLSIIDHVISRNYVPLLSFYSTNHDNTHAPHPILALKKSLSQVLSQYYPFAGMLRDQVSIECNDQGVTLIVTSLKCNMSWILNNPTETSLNPLFPDELQWKPLSSSLVAIQINSFACGGIAISVCMCHKVGDAATLSNFINDWATINRHHHEQQQQTEFTLLTSPVSGATFFPIEKNSPIFPESKLVKNDTVVCRRFVFEASKIDSLKAIVSSHNVPNPSRVQVVSALIYKRAVYSLRLSSKTTSFRTAVNLRNRAVPPLPEKSMGNLVWFLFMSNPRETELHELVMKMKQGLTEFHEMCVKKLRGKGKDLSFISERLKQDTSESESLVCYSSWCRFAMYEADFGWGKPVWITSSGCPVKNIIILMDTSDGFGIEALVSMEEKDMVRFQSDVELLQYASLNPSLVGYGE